MDKPITHLVIHDLRVAEDEIVVGATDNERWRWDIENGDSGADAKTLVYVLLVHTGYSNDGRDFYTEKAGFHCQPGDPTREIAMTHLLELFEVAWSIANEKLDIEMARKRYFGKPVVKANKHL